MSTSPVRMGGLPTSRRSAFLFKAMRRYTRRYIARHFHALRVSRSGPIPDLAPASVLIVLNHPSWWDPLVAIVLTEWMPGSRLHYGPIESRGLAQYPFLERIGFFGIDTASTRGAREYLRMCREILSRPESVLWITAQGRFADCRERPPGLKQGIGHLVHRLTDVVVIPLALEYPFWNDRCPEILVRFGESIAVERGRDRPPQDWTALVEASLQQAQDRLAAESLARDPKEFETVLGGSAGVGGVYDLWRRFKARLGGREFRAEHQVMIRAGEKRSSRITPGPDESPHDPAPLP